MTQMALGKSWLWQRQLPRADLWYLNYYAMLSCCNHFAICYVPWCFRTLEIVVWFNVFGVVCGLLETWSIMLPEGGRSEVEKGIAFHYRLSKMNLWKISSDSIYYGKWKTNYILLKGPPRFFCETIGTTYVAKPALCTILILKGLQKYYSMRETNPCEWKHWLYVACLRQETRCRHDIKHLGYHQELSK